jgi:hypothetical protein
MKVGDVFDPRKVFSGGLPIPPALAASTLVSPTAKLVYGYLIQRAGEDGQSGPTPEEIGKHIGVSARAARIALAELEDQRFIRACPETEGE